MLKSGFVNRSALLQTLVANHRIPRVNIQNTKIPLDTLAALPEALARRVRCLPIDEIDDILVVVTPDLENAEALATLRAELGRRLALIQCGKEGFDKQLNDYYQRYSKRQRNAQIPNAPQPSTPLGALSVGAQKVQESMLIGSIPLRAGRREASWAWRYTTSGPVPARPPLKL